MIARVIAGRVIRALDGRTNRDIHSAQTADRDVGRTAERINGIRLIEGQAHLFRRDLQISDRERYEFQGRFVTRHGAVGDQQTVVAKVQAQAATKLLDRNARPTAKGKDIQ